MIGNFNLILSRILRFFVVNSSFVLSMKNSSFFNIILIVFIVISANSFISAQSPSKTTSESFASTLFSRLNDYSDTIAMPGFFDTVKTLGKFVTSSKKYDKSSEWKPEMGSLYDLKVNDLDGKPFDLSTLKGKVALVCNVASECGYTKCGYKFLQEEQLKYESRGFTVLGFPCNQFGGQEPGGPADIRDFAVNSFKTTFPLLEKVDVNGPSTHPVWQYLKGVYPGDVTWNFHGFFVINEEGIPIRRFHKEPYPEIDAFIKKTLDERDSSSSSSSSESSESSESAAAKPDAATESS